MGPIVTARSAIKSRPLRLLNPSPTKACNPIVGAFRPPLRNAATGPKTSCRSSQPLRSGQDRPRMPVSCAATLLDLFTRYQPPAPPKIDPRSRATPEGMHCGVMTLSSRDAALYCAAGRTPAAVELPGTGVPGMGDFFEDSEMLPKSPEPNGPPKKLRKTGGRRNTGRAARRPVRIPRRQSRRSRRK